jgi:TonB-dependent SusC/RagA subfamily outer membrane receptor
MRKPITLLVFLLMAGIQVAFAQKTVNGTITTSVDNSPLAGVSVQVKGTTTGGITDANGKFSVSVPDDQAILIFSFIGFESEEIPVGGQSIIDISLDESVTLVSEIVVTALGIKREEKSLGYAVTVVETDEILKSKTINIMQSLEGRVSGLNVTPPAAGAGSSTQIRLRGQAAFQGANNAPLIVVNGLPIDQGASGVNGLGEPRDLGDNMNSFNPDDIETMTVLKGATAAAAIYGSRAANGAILITTKSGQRNQGIGIEYSGSYAAQKPLNYMDDIQYIYGQGRLGARPISAADAAGTGQFGWGAKMDGGARSHF